MPEIDDPRFDAQYARIQEAYDALGIPIFLERNPDTGEPVAIYPNDRLVVRVERLEQAQAALPPNIILRAADVETIRGLRVVLVDGQTAREARATIEGALGPDAVDFDYILSITPAGKCPATEPDVPTASGGLTPPYPPVAVSGGTGVSVAVCDTGLLVDASSHSWLTGVTGDPDPLGPIDAATGLPVIPLYTGHGTFIAGTLRCIAPEAQVQVLGDLPANQASTAVVTAIVLSLTKLLTSGVRVISLSAGSTLPLNKPGLVFDQFVAINQAALADAVIVAAAGNNSDTTPFFPAAIRAPWMLSVGALDTAGKNLASFSDFNPSSGPNWIDVFAPGEDLVNAYASGLYVYDWPPRQGSRQVFGGMARWSGTSFSTPLVAGLLVAQMSAAGLTPQQARTALLNLATAQAIPGVGPALTP